MNIVIVLCFLATFAIAVPVYQENVFKSSLNNQPSSTKREKKTALPDITSGLSPEYGIEKIETHSNKNSGKGTSVEAKSFRRPIIIKRKLGYHVYRDSDEEMAYAEPGEKCREQVKFKLCDHEPVSSSKNRIKSPTFKCMESYKTDNEMENSIKMAKQAVEYLQKDLKRMENFSPKMANPHIEDIESHSGLHHDIEIAREALENIEQNFESVNLEVNKVNELQIPKSQDVERLTRWREAIENIHKNFEIVKNIEDAFQTDKHFSLFRSNNKKADESEEPTNTQSHFHVQNKFANDNSEIYGEPNNEVKILKSASNDDRIAQLTLKTVNIDNIGKDVGYDMFISPTENRERKVQLHSDSLKSEINYKDASLRNDANEIEFTKQDTNLPKESIEYSPKNLNYLSEVPTNKEHEKTTNDNINNDYKLDIERHPEERTLQYSKSVPELPNDPMLLITTKEKDDITDDQHAHKEVAGIRSSESQNDKLQLNEYREEPRYASTRLDIENNSDDTTAQLLPLDKEKIANDQQSLREEASMKSLVSEKMQSRKNQEERESIPMELGIERRSEKRVWQTTKSVPEQPYDPMLSVTTSEKGDNIDDQNAHKEEASMRSSENQNEKSQLNEYREEPKKASTRLYIENSSDDTISQNFKSVPELQPYPVDSLPLEKGDTTNDQQFYREEASMRSSESQNEKMQSSDNQEQDKLVPTELGIERLPEERIWQDAKSVPELSYDPMLSVTTSEKVDNTDDQHAHKDEASMKSSESQNEKIQWNENQEEPELLPTALGIERLPEERIWQDAKSVPELPYDPMLSVITLEKFDNTDVEQAHNDEANMRSSENQNEKMQASENQEEHELLPTRLGIESLPEERIWQDAKSVPELSYDPILLIKTSEKIDNINEQHVQNEEASMRSSESQYKKSQLNEYREEPKKATPRLDVENRSGDTEAQYLKSVDELQPYPVESLPFDKGDTTNNQQPYREEASMRLSGIENEKMQSRETQEEYELLPTGLGIERLPEERIWQDAKSVPELPYDPLLSVTELEKVDNTDDQHAHKEETSMRSSVSQNKKMKSKENQVEHELLPTALDIERHPEKRIWQDAKSVPELPYDPLLSVTAAKKVDNTDDQHAHKEEASMRSSESQNEKSQLNEHQEEPKKASPRLYIESSSDDTAAQNFKSVSELQPYPVESLPLDKGDTINDQQSYRTEVSLRASESQNEKMQSNENQEEHELLPAGLGIERLPDERMWQDAKSVAELPYDSMLSVTASEKVDNTDDRHAHKEEASMRSSENQNEKLQVSKYQEEPRQASTGFDNENSSDDTTFQYFKSVPEPQRYPFESLPLDKEAITNDQQSHNKEANMRSSERQNEKMQASENQEEHELLPTRLGIESLPEERIWQDAKSVPELAYDPMLLIKTSEKIDNTDDQHAHKEEASMRSSESQNEKSQLTEYREEPKKASTRLDIENSSDDTTAQYYKSVPELQPYPVESLLLDKGDNTNDQQSYREKASMRSSESQNEKMQSSENQKEHELLPTGLGIERLLEERILQGAKSVSELSYDPMLSVTTLEKVDKTDDQHAHKDEANMRSSDSQNEKMPANENPEEHELLPTALGIERLPEERIWQDAKSVPELLYDPMLSVTTSEKVDNTDVQHAYKDEANMRSPDSQNEKMPANENPEEHELLPTGLSIQSLPEERIWQDAKSVPELTYDPMLSVTTSEKVDNTDDQHAHKDEASMKSSESQNEKMQWNENQEEHELLPTALGIERRPEERIWQDAKSVPELPYDPMLSVITLEKVDNADVEHAHNDEANMRSSENQNEKMQASENQEEHELLPTGLGIESLPEERIWQDAKSVPELTYDPILLLKTSEKIDNINDQHAQNEEASMRSSESQYEKSQLNEYREEPKKASPRLDVENRSGDTEAQYLKSVYELQPYPVESLPFDKGDTTNDQQFYREEASMRSLERPNEKIQSSENQEVHEMLPMGINFESHPEERTWQYSKSVPELPYDPMLSMPTAKVGNTIHQHAYKEEANMKSSDIQNEKLQLNENQETQEPLMIQLDTTNHPEDRKWLFSKSVPEFSYDPMVSMPSDNIEITNLQHFLKNGNMRLSQNQYERTPFDEHHGLNEFSPTKLDDARLSQTQRERQQIYFNHHLYEPHSSRFDIKSKLEDDSLPANKLRFNYIQNPTNERTVMRVSLNQNENKEVQNPSTSLGLSNDMSGVDNAASMMNDFMLLNEAQPQQLHENRDPMLRSSNERHHLSFNNFNSLPEYKMLPQTSNFEFSNGQNALNEHSNMRINQEQSRDPEPIENQYKHNSLPMRWNTENQQDPSPKTFKSNLDFDHTLYKGNEFGKEQFIPASKTVNTLGYRSRPQLYGDHILDDTPSSRWDQTVQHNDRFENYYKTIPEMQEENTNPHFRNHLHRVALNHRLNDADTFTSHDFPSSRARLYDHVQKYHQEKPSNIDSSMEPSMHMSMRDPFAKSSTEFKNMYFNHPHGTARFVKGLPIAGVSPGAMGVFPTGNAGGCGIPLLLSCSPSIVSGSLARPNIVGPLLKSVDENFKYYIKRDAKNIADEQDIKVQKLSLPHSHGAESASEI